jgi:colicin import membrane protein
VPKAEPDTRAADLALKAKQEDERKKREKLEREKKEAERQRLEEQQRLAAQRALEQQRLAEAQRAAEQKRAAEQQRLTEQKRVADQKRLAAVREAQSREAEAEAQAQARDAQRRDAAARDRSSAEYVDRIRAKIRGNVIVPPDAAPSLVAEFTVLQLPTGEIIDVKPRRSSGNRAYDEAVYRAILKSSPLPRPDRADLFQRELVLTFRPEDLR